MRTGALRWGAFIVLLVLISFVVLTPWADYRRGMAHSDQMLEATRGLPYTEPPEGQRWPDEYLSFWKTFEYRPTLFYRVYGGGRQERWDQPGGDRAAEGTDWEKYRFCLRAAAEPGACEKHPITDVQLWNEVSSCLDEVPRRTGEARAAFEKADKQAKAACMAGVSCASWNLYGSKKQYCVRTNDAGR